MTNKNALNIKTANEVRAIQAKKEDAAREERFIQQLLRDGKIRSVSEYHRRKAA